MNRRTSKKCRLKDYLETVKKLCFSDNLYLDYVNINEKKSSCTETFSLSKYKKSGTCPDFLCICVVNAILCVLPRISLTRISKILFRQIKGRLKAYLFARSTLTE